MTNPTIPKHNLNFSPFPPLTPQNVAVIGAGAAGLVAARELRREGHKVVVFEREIKVGGTWVYNPSTESYPLGLDPTRVVIHSSLYASLRTNLPREVMGFRDYPFVVQRDPRRFSGHVEVLEYLNNFETEFGLGELVRLGAEVRRVWLEGGKWKIRSRMSVRGDLDEVYDAVVVCNGHYTEPRIAEIPGIETWPGLQIHSHNYRIPEPFQGQVVILIGSSASAVDICRDIAGVAKEVHVASRSVTYGPIGKLPGHDNMWLHSMIESAHGDGIVVFRDGSAVCADVILHCTGYKYTFPFLDTNGAVTVDDNPPSLSFVGLPWKVVPFPLCELQSKWIADVSSGRVSLPSSNEMMADVEAFYRNFNTSGIPKHYTHNLGDSLFEYNDWLASECECPPSDEWGKEMYSAASKNRKVRPETYRDKWDDEDLAAQAREDFECFSKGNRNLSQ
ncbi:hypothetical protein Vadar_007012 [Vaccinium darrowii]|uniref:Uncharacterized protein n=1 Tax=Vaccinium darrowii TaxID=229202 RepID=A0ACB7ZA43_9ERIC|nr:hypothetical protein Vadar_007012 [Vaccinium darrowii]